MKSAHFQYDANVPNNRNYNHGKLSTQPPYEREVSHITQPWTRANKFGISLDNNEN
jgi:hypothetical protein